MTDENVQLSVSLYAADSEYDNKEIRAYLVERARRQMATYLAQYPELALLDSPAGKWVRVEEEPQFHRHWEYRLLAEALEVEP